MSTYPSVVATLTDPNATDRLNSPSHSSIHTAENDEIKQTQRFVGTTSSAVGTLMYDVRAAASNGGGHVQTANKGGTGYTSYTKGDLLVASSSSVLAKLAIGQDGAGLIADSSVAAGVKWGSFPANPTVRTYTGSGTGGASSLVAVWTKPSIISYAIIEIVGGGGGGGGTTTDETGTNGGGAGGYSRKTVLAANLPTAASVSVGLGGNAGPGSGAGGGTGGTTWFGSVISATGGTGGLNNAGGVDGEGTGGVGSGGDINARGGGGGAGNYNATSKTGGAGGNSYFGGGGVGIMITGNTDGPGYAGGAYGGGGGGAVNGTGGDVAGGAGAPGVVIITEY